MDTRKAFENHMLRMNPCTRMARQKTDGTYRTVTVERAWQVWSAAASQEREECAALCIASDGRDVGMTGANCNAAILARRNQE